VNYDEEASISSLRIHYRLIMVSKEKPEIRRREREREREREKAKEGDTNSKCNEILQNKNSSTRMTSMMT
jgi:hypothetical protein